MSDRDTALYGLVGLSAWLNGAVAFHFGGRLLFESGPWVTVLVGLVIALMVCAVFRATFSWRNAKPSDAVAVAAIMALPGLFGETARQIAFPWATGLRDADAPAFAAVIFFGNAVLLSYAVLIARRAR